MSRGLTQRGSRFTYGLYVGFAVLALAGCGGDSTETVDTGLGFEVEVDTSGSEDDQFHSLVQAIYERLDLDEEFRACALNQIDDFSYEEVEAVSDLPETERARRIFQTQKQIDRACVESGDDIIATDADAETVNVFRRAVRSSTEFILSKPPAVAEPVASCILQQIDSLPSAQLIELANSTYREQAQSFFEFGRSCR